MQDFETLESIKGIIFKKKDVVVQNPGSEIIKNLDIFPHK